MRRHFWIGTVILLFSISTPSFADQANRHSPDNTDNTDPDPSTDNTDTDSHTTQPPTQSEKQPAPKPSDKDFDDLIEAIGDSTEAGKVIAEFFQKYPSMSQEDLIEAVQQIFNKSVYNYATDFFLKSLEHLPEEQRKQIETALLELKPEQIADLLKNPDLSKVPKELQQNLIRKVLPAILENPQWAKEKPKWLDGLAKRSRISDFQFSQTELEKLVFEQHAFNPEFVKPLFSRDPKAVQKVLDLLTSHSDSNVALDAFQAVNEYQASLAQTALTQLSQSKNPKDLLRAAYFFVSQNKGESTEVVNRLLEIANKGELVELSGVLRKSNQEELTKKLNLDGLSPERLTELSQWALEDGDLRSFIYPTALSKLVVVAPTAALAVALSGLKLDFPDSESTLNILDSLPPESARKLSGLAPQVVSDLIQGIKELGKSLGENKQDSLGLSLAGTKFLGHFPGAIRPHESDLKDFALGKSGPVQDFAFSLLSLTGNPESRDFILERASKESGRLGVSAARHLSQMLERNPDLITPELKKGLSKILQSQDGGDLTRLALRQSLPPMLFEQINDDILSALTRRLRDREVQGINPDAKVSEATTQAALQLFGEAQSNGLLGLGERALALRYLVVTGHPEAARMTGEFLNETSRASANPVGSLGYQHNLNQLQGLLTDARRVGLEIDPELAIAVEKQINGAAEAIWNRGPASRTFINQNPDGTTSRDSNLVSYSVAAYLAESIDPKNPSPTPTQEKMVAALKKTEKSFSGAIPYDLAGPGAHERKADYDPELDPAPTVGRTLTAATAQYLASSNLQAPGSKEKEERAQRILDLADTYLTHFSQTHETPRNSNRSHDRTPGGQGMAPYYGPSNDIHFSQAMKLIAEDPTLPQSVREEARKYSDEMRIRLLTHANEQGLFPQRSIQNFPGENQAYQILMGLALWNLPSRTLSQPSKPASRLLQSALK